MLSARMEERSQSRSEDQKSQKQEGPRPHRFDSPPEGRGSQHAAAGEECRDDLAGTANTERSDHLGGTHVGEKTHSSYSHLREEKPLTEKDQIRKKKKKKKEKKKKKKKKTKTSEKKKTRKKKKKKRKKKEKKEKKKKKKRRKKKKKKKEGTHDLFFLRKRRTDVEVHRSVQMRKRGQK